MNISMETIQCVVVCVFVCVCVCVRVCVCVCNAGHGLKSLDTMLVLLRRLPKWSDIIVNIFVVLLFEL